IHAADPSFDAAASSHVTAVVQGYVDRGEYRTITLAVRYVQPVPGEVPPTVDEKLIVIDALQLYFSASCLDASGKLSCDALGGVTRVPSQTFSIGVGNPAYYYCTPAGGTETVEGTDARGESGLCRFADGSLIDEWSLVYTPSDALRQ